MTDYMLIFQVALVVNVLITFRSSALWTKYFGRPVAAADDASSSSSSIELKQRHAKLLRKYLLVYLLATLSDWFQGPYVYALYDAYGFSQHDIAVLFVAGFGSSMVFGSFIGGMADWGGRRRFVVLFSIIYAASCLTKHFNDYWILMIGRLLGGIATSLLFSVFEAWLIRSHSDAGLPKQFLNISFAWAAYGNSIIAIIAGLVANKAANISDMVGMMSGSASASAEGDEGETTTTSSTLHVGGYLNPFDLALLALVACGLAAATMWEENYGTSDGGSSGGVASNSDGNKSDDEMPPAAAKKEGSAWYAGLKDAFVATMRSRDILLCGIIASLFEGSMYIFVFMWTPALKALIDENDDLPFGLIFSTFMVSCMAGSSLFSFLIKGAKGELLGVGVFLVSSISMAIVCSSNNSTLMFVMMLVFEVMVGMYWPIMGTMKGAIVPEDKRAAIYNLYRIPLNFVVLFSLLTDLTPTQSFLLNAIMLGIATLLQLILMKRRSLNGETEKSSLSSTTETKPLMEDQGVV
eukprot:CAMPEP_0194048556 /NCGR_PEP_ID=MMETSP0009_2-20130614/27669_1 /TAXON_ID=210454 /ORGANISM="Grammatophora oceanica, Strain CCMP 410" /LENGTH=521 /DNA_ID=CAMNT_0038694465 /DNA_START=52 /DNA_END=1617 /DNA_ORIENTATION=+